VETETYYKDNGCGEVMYHKEWSDDEKSVMTFSTDHWIKVKIARVKWGLPVNADNSTIIKNHWLMNKRLLEKSTGKIYNIASILRSWHFGRYTSLLIEHNNSHGQCWIEYEKNIAHRDLYEEQEERFFERFEVID